MKSTSPSPLAFVGRSQRAADRFTSELPIEINGLQGLTRNISATGVYFETTRDQAPGSRVHFVVEVTVNGERLKMVCAGEVVRVEHKDATVGVAVKLANSFFADTADAGDEEGLLEI
jgi:hypothetical protein